jgi:hypothetical protein
MIRARNRRFLAPAALVAVAALASAVPLTGQASAQIALAKVVSEDPANFTPNVVDDAAVSDAAVYAFGQIGGTMYAGGTFHTVSNSTRTVTTSRSNLMSFSATTGALTSFAPAVNGPVWAIVPAGSSIYVGGEFTTVNGVTRRALAKLDATTGALDPQFNPVLFGKVTEARIVNGRLLIGGTFKGKLLALDPATGKDTGYINLGIAGSVASNAGPERVYKFAVNPAGTRLVAIGNFTTVSGQSRPRIFMATLGATSATLNAWNYGPAALRCAASSIPEQLRDVDFSPDGAYFVVVDTGFVPASTSQIGTALCDSAARFETETASPSRPTWINYTGGDTLHSVAITGSAVYVQGHQRWLDNAGGRDFAGPGAVARQGIGAIDPTSGKALSWNPGKSRDVGGKELFVTPAGLWVGSDGKLFRGEIRSGIAFCPLV